MFAGYSSLDRLKEESIQEILRCFARALMMIFFKLLSVFHALIKKHSSQGAGAVHPLDTVVSQAENNHEVVEDIKEELVNPCLERIQRLEEMFSEIKRKPAEIPADKERVLMDSWYRIKSIEFDLEKTKRVCFCFHIQEFML